MDFTIKQLCDFLNAEIPASLSGKENHTVKGINARYTTIEKGDVFFDINEDCPDIGLINPKTCPFIISDRYKDGDLNIPVVEITDALEKYVALCRAFVDEYPDTTCIAVTGSTGKTSMKETIAAVLGNVVATDKTQSNQNNIYFLSKRLQKVMPKNLRYYVQEACIKVYNDINLTFKLAQAVNPKIVVMNNIYDNHAEVYGNRETTFKIKSSLVEYMGECGTAFLNYDDDILRNYHPRCKAYYYSLNDSNADIYADNIVISNNGTDFDIHWQGRVIKNVHCRMIGRPNIYNCMVAFAIGSINGIDDETLVRSIGKFNIAYALRQNHFRIGGYNLFVDCFNASYESIASDMNTMDNLSPDEGGRKVVVVGDVAELGEKAEEIHKRIGSEIVRHKMDRFFCYGKYSSNMYEGAIEVNPTAPIAAFEDCSELVKSVSNYIRPGDLILWKASRDTHIELAIDEIFGTDYYTPYPREYDKEAIVYSYDDGKVKEHLLYYKVGAVMGGLLGAKLPGEFAFCAYENGIKIAKYNSTGKKVILPPEIGEVSVRSIGDRAFYKSNISSVTLPDSVHTLCTNAFLRCTKLRTVKLSENIKYIDYSAFAYCSSLEEITIPASCQIIRDNAFLECKRLKSVIVEGMNTLIEPRALDGADKVGIRCKSGSLAERFALENNIKYSINVDENAYGEWIVPAAKEKVISINGVSWKRTGEKSRIEFSITTENANNDTLWYEVEKKWEEYICDDRVDAIVVSILLFLLRGRYTKITSSLPISKRLKYQLEYNLIPQILEAEGTPKPYQLKIDIPTTDKVYEKPFVANGTGFSRGVDSFATLYEYGNNSTAPEDYKVNFLNVYNVGAFHGKDGEVRSRKTSNELFMEQYSETVHFAEKYGYNALVVDSNLYLFLNDNFNSKEYGMLRKFQSSASERNIGTTLLFQKLFTRFYYASGHTLKEFKISLDESSALWEQYAVQFFSTENTTFYISNRNWTRMDKVKHVAELPESYDNLQVCLLNSKNCGKCMKCTRTLMNLDVLGDDVLNRYANSFDLNEYREETREKLFSTIWTDQAKDGYVKDIFRAAIENDFDLVVNPKLKNTQSNYTYRYRNSEFLIRKAPSYLAEEIAYMNNDSSDMDMTIEGVTPNKWVKVTLENGESGFVGGSKLSLKKEKPAQMMKLNAGSFLTLLVGKKYGLLPVFTPDDANEQVKYISSDESVAYVTKTGWVYSVKPGQTVIKATSKNGLTAECLVYVVSEIKTPESFLKRIANHLPAGTQEVLRSAWHKIKK